MKFITRRPPKQGVAAPAPQGPKLKLLYRLAKIPGLVLMPDTALDSDDWQPWAYPNTTFFALKEPVYDSLQIAAQSTNIKYTQAKVELLIDPAKRVFQVPLSAIETFTPAPGGWEPILPRTSSVLNVSGLDQHPPFYEGSVLGIKDLPTPSSNHNRYVPARWITVKVDSETKTLISLRKEPVIDSTNYAAVASLQGHYIYAFEEELYLVDDILSTPFSTLVAQTQRFGNSANLGNYNLPP